MYTYKRFTFHFQAKKGAFFTMTILFSILEQMGKKEVIGVMRKEKSFPREAL